MATEPTSANEPSPPSSGADALALLRADHVRLDAMFDDYERLTEPGSGTETSGADHSAMLVRIGALLKTHTQIETELFYPALASSASAKEIDRALAEHEAMEAHIQQLNELQAHNHAVDEASVHSLAVSVRAHAVWEEMVLFQVAQRSGIDLDALGTQLAARRAQLLGDQGAD